MVSTNGNIYCLGNARFTIITPNCIRMEYSENANFIDAPSWFAVNRQYAACEHRLQDDKDRWTINTGCIELSYRKSSEPFSASSLTAEFKFGNGSAHWVFGMNNTANLVGTLQTLDGIQKAMPLPEGLISRDGWYCLDDSSSHLFVGNWIEPRPENSGSDFYLFAYGNNFKLALQTLTTISGSVPLPRKCIFGSWYSRWYSYTSDDYRNIVKEFDEHKIPLDIMVMDMDWHDKEKATHGHGWANMLGWTGWSWNKDLIPDAEALLKWYHDQGLNVTLNVHPHDGVREHEDCYADFMNEIGEKPDKPVPFTAGNKKYLDAYFNIAHGQLEKQGVDFWWVDWQQDSIMPEAEGIKGMKHLPLLNHAYFKFSERSAEKRGLGFSRWAGWGDQRYPIHFSGDAQSNWDMLAFEIYFTATASNVGCFFWSHDIGGFCGKRDPELYARWVQFGVATAAMRMHSTGDELDRRPWKWDTEVEESIRQSFQLRSQLMPYIYSQAAKSCRDSIPLCRPLYYDYPDDERSYQAQHQYLFGDAFLVAPVISKRNSDGYATTKVWLPNGEWANWFTGEIYDGNQMIEQKSDINTFPFFVKTGFPVVMQPMTLRMTSNIPDEYTVTVFPGKRDCMHESDLYTDDGISQKYKDGEYSLVKLKFKQTGDTAELDTVPEQEIANSNLSNQKMSLNLHGNHHLSKVYMNKKQVPLA